MRRKSTGFVRERFPRATVVVLTLADCQQPTTDANQMVDSEALVSKDSAERYNHNH